MEIVVLVLKTSIVPFICNLAIFITVLKLVIAPVFILIFGGLKVGGVAGIIMITIGVAMGFGEYSLFAAAKAYRRQFQF